MHLSQQRRLQAGVYVLAGLNHFLMSDFYVRAIPDYLPRKRLLNALSGVGEVAAGLGLLYAPTRRAAAWGIVGLLVAFLPVHTHMLRRNQFGLPKAVLWARLPLQGLLIALAHRHTRPVG